jgi:hypothetical protein
MKKDRIDPVQQLIEAETAIIEKRLGDISTRIEELKDEPKNRDGFKCLARRLKFIAAWTEKLKYIQAEATKKNFFPALREATEVFYDLQGFALSRSMGPEEPTLKDYKDNIADCKRTILFGRIRNAIEELIRKG